MQQTLEKGMIRTEGHCNLRHELGETRITDSLAGGQRLALCDYLRHQMDRSLLHASYTTDFRLDIFSLCRCKSYERRRTWGLQHDWRCH